MGRFPEGLRSGELAGGALSCAMVVALFVSGPVLNLFGLGYSSTDTAATALKVHPYTIILLVAVLPLLARRGALRRGAHGRWLATFGAGTTLVLAAVLAVKALTTGTQAIGFVVDTLWAACLGVAITPLVAKRWRRFIWRTGLVFVVANSLLAIGEGALREHLVPFQFKMEEAFRATALQGHPLNNALIVSSLAFLYQRHYRGVRAVGIFCIVVLALFAFGTRAALVVYVLGSVAAFAKDALRSPGRLAVFWGAGLIVLTSLIGLWASGALGTRIATVGLFGDQSSETRLDSLRILSELDQATLTRGATNQDAEELAAAADVGTVENFAVIYVMCFGLPMACVVLLLLIFVLISVSRLAHGRRRTEAIWSSCLFMVLALANNSLATKTSALLLFLVCLVSFSDMASERPVLGQLSEKGKWRGASRDWWNRPGAVSGTTRNAAFHDLSFEGRRGLPVEKSNSPVASR